MNQKLIIFKNKANKFWIKNKADILIYGGMGLATLGSAGLAFSTYRLGKIKQKEVDTGVKDETPKWKVVTPIAVSAVAIIGGDVSILLGNKDSKLVKAALATSLATTTATLENYRQTVAEEIGKDREEELYSGIGEVEVEEHIKTEKGRNKTVKTTKKVVMGDALYPYQVDFTKSPMYTGNADNDRQQLLKTMSYEQTLCNMSRGRMLSDTLHSLGFTNTKDFGIEALMAGWDDGDFIDFGLDNPRNEDFMTGKTNEVTLFFNCHPNVIIDVDRSTVKEIAY